MKSKFFTILSSAFLIMLASSQASQRNWAEKITQYWTEDFEQYPQTKKQLSVESVTPEQWVTLKYESKQEAVSPYSYTKMDLKAQKIDVLALVKKFQNNPQVTFSGLEKLN